MEINNELDSILMEAFNEAVQRKHEYLTPEHLLFATLKNSFGKKIIEASGGDVESLKNKLENFFKETMVEVDIPEPGQSISFQNILERAIWHISSAQKPMLEIGDVLVSILEEKESFAAFFLSEEGVSKLALLEYISHGTSDFLDELEELESIELTEEELEKEESKDEKILKAYTIDLIKKAANNEIDPLIGREDVIERTIQVLCRRTKHNPIHVGEPGVGKTAITEGLAQKIYEGNVPEAIKNSKIYSIDMGTMVAGTKFRGDFEERMKKVLKAIEKQENPIIFIDEIHTIVGAGAVSGGSLDASNLLKPILSSNKIKCIGSTTYEEFKKYFDKDRALSRRFQKIDVPEPTITETIEILKGLQKHYEAHHNVKYTDEAIKTVAELSAKYINDRFLPDKAIDVIDEAGSFARIKNNSNDEITINSEDIEKVIAKIAKIPEKSINSTEKEKLQNLEKSLLEKIFGQQDSITKVCKSINKSRAGFGNPERPVASFLFVGPTGVGKTELAKQIAASLGIKMLRFDMSEYQEKHTVARLIGSPPGYVGYEDGGLLTDEIRKNPHAVLLLDEIEKAHQDIFNTLLQVMDYATLTDNNGKKADFRNIIIIMTSNAGAREIGKNKLGFGERKIKEDAIDNAIEKFFSPEFRNRLDAIITFNNLSKENILKIVKREATIFIKQLAEKNVNFEITEKTYEWLTDKGYSPEFGAREIARLIDEQLKHFFVDEVLFGKLANGGKAIADINDNKIQIKIL